MKMSDLHISVDGDGFPAAGRSCKIVVDGIDISTCVTRLDLRIDAEEVLSANIAVLPGRVDVATQALVRIAPAARRRWWHSLRRLPVGTDG